MEHLDRLSVLDLGVLLVAHRLCQLLVNLLPQQPPGRRVLHPEEMVAFGDDLLADEVHRTVTGNGASLVQKLLGDTAVGYHGSSAGAELDGVETAVLLRPFRESNEVSVCSVFGLIAMSLRTGSRPFASVVDASCQ